jgi:hypothetical protein
MYGLKNATGSTVSLERLLIDLRLSKGTALPEQESSSHTQ